MSTENKAKDTISQYTEYLRKLSSGIFKGTVTSVPAELAKKRAEIDIKRLVEAIHKVGVSFMTPQTTKGLKLKADSYRVNCDKPLQQLHALQGVK